MPSLAARLRFFLGVTLVATALLASTNQSATPDPEKGFEWVTYGSSFKLTHRATQTKLYSKDVRYGSGSGQRSVTAVAKKDDPVSLWTVQGSIGNDATNPPPVRGAKVPCGATVRLQHVTSMKFYLHSHNFQSPLSQQFEVSAFDGVDGGDHWVLECAKGESHWLREKPVFLRHVDTQGYLAAAAEHKYSSPIDGHLEVVGAKRRGDHAKWVAEDGFYFQAREA
ncbi:hypothetical protein IWQ60_001120 [Tieghemiomyces parasiticus]|uniref:MIR domain-containing protein n=1 Tax=Tieghemiomyces parasiticus TaxID=78921 RepID=A0A9W8AEL6_9FUNG|nr:hypothetical protein IWQ60_001120 [Tieghemiomyces parasiticus]